MADNKLKAFVDVREFEYIEIIVKDGKIFVYDVSGLQIL